MSRNRSGPASACADSEPGIVKGVAANDTQPATPLAESLQVLWLCQRFRLAPETARHVAVPAFDRGPER
jgi:hypothetical protein